jgi:hypothetical protein
MMASWASVNVGSGIVAQEFVENCKSYFSDTLYKASPDQLTAALLSTEGAFKSYMQSLRKIHKGNAVRDIAKAKRLGYFCAPFDYSTHIHDMAEINLSKEFRQNRRMSSSYQRTSSEMGRCASRLYAEERAGADYKQAYGVFLYEKDYYQAELKTNQRLCGYINFHRLNELGIYSMFLGHGSHLNNGIMYLLHSYVARCIWKDVRYILYGAHWGWPLPAGHQHAGMQMWKRRMRFEPSMLHVEKRV